MNTIFSSDYFYNDIVINDNDIHSVGLGCFYYNGGSGAIWINFLNGKVQNWIGVKAGAVVENKPTISIYGKLK